MESWSKTRTTNGKTPGYPLGNQDADQKVYKPVKTDYTTTGAPEGIGVYDLRMLVEMQNELFKSLEPYFRMLGLKLYVDRIVMYPEGCEGKCIEYVWRIECDSVEVCEEIRKKIQEQQMGVEVGGGEEEA